VIAAVGNVDARAAQEQAVIASRAAGVAQARAQAELAAQQVDRYGRLAEQGWVSQARIQTEQAGARTAQASVAEAEAALVAEQRTAGVLGSTRSQSLAAVDVARARVEQARIALDRTVIRAPVGGVVGARGVRVGQYVRPGGQILSIVPLGDAYVVANFKETQLDRLRLGQTVEISADAFPGEPLVGHIESFAPATGSEFALIPVENATGNFTNIDPKKLDGIVIDDADAELAGVWSKGEGLKPFVGDHYSYASAKGASARFGFAVKQTGSYEVRAYWQPHANRGRSVPVTILSADGEKTVTVNQTRPASGKNGAETLGTFKFNAGEEAAVIFRTEGAQGNVHLDGVQVVPVK